eukprot:s3812_g5.t1
MDSRTGCQSMFARNLGLAATSQFANLDESFDSLLFEAALFISIVSSTFNHGHEPCASGWACAPGHALAWGRLNDVTQVGATEVTQVPLPSDSFNNNDSSSLLPPREGTNTSRRTWDLLLPYVARVSSLCAPCALGSRIISRPSQW